MKPILFNTEMVRAILEGRKTVTRRVIRPEPGEHGLEYSKPLWKRRTQQPCWHCAGREYNPPYQPGDILYVRETWAPLYPDMYSDVICGYIYKAEPLSVGNYDRRFPNGENYKWEGKWRPSIHMPKEAARLFLRVTSVRVEHLQDITEEQARAEGAEPFCLSTDGEGVPDSERTWHEVGPALWDFIRIWYSTIKPADREKYGWDVNPFVWVIEFERYKLEENET